MKTTLDFEAFKAMMLHYKIEAKVATESSEQDQAFASEEIIPFETFQSRFNEDLGQHKWKSKHECKEKDFAKKGWKCIIYSRPQQGTKINLIRVDAQLKNINRKAMMDYFEKGEEDEGIQEFRELE